MCHSASRGWRSDPVAPGVDAHSALRREHRFAALPCKHRYLRLSRLPQASPEHDTQAVALPRAADRREHPFFSNELWASPDKEVGAVIEASCTLSRRFSPLRSRSIGTALTFAGLRTSPGFGNGGGVSGHSCISQQGGRARRRPSEALGRRLRQAPPSGHPS